MVKTIKSIGVWTAFFSLCFVQFALANQLVISGDYAFLADGNLKIYNIVDPQDTDPEEIIIGDATAVAVSGNKAVVTKDNGSELSIQIVDISYYVGQNPDTDTNDSNEYLGTYDIQEGVITLPRVAINETIHTLTMKRRGLSNNWEITFAEPVSEITADNDDE